MNNLPNHSPQLSEEEAAQLLRSLLHKEGSWVDWGKACQKLQKAGYSAPKIFEETGFQASQQNLVIVAAQVYETIAEADGSDELLAYLKGPRSDVLYEFRILNQQQRVAVAQVAQEKQLEADSARELAKATQELSRSQLPEGFTKHPGDAVAYQCWRRARQKKDLQERSRLIAKGLKFAHSQSAREAIEKLLSDFTITPSRTAPLMPVYRLEAEDDLPRIVPVAGSYPLTKAEFEAVSSLESHEPFRIVDSGSNPMVPLPGWQAVLKAQDPVVIVYQSDRLPKPLSGKPETVLVVVDRDSTEWNVNSYFLIEQNEQLELKWFEELPNLLILGQVVLVLRPKKILDEGNITQPWQMDD